MAEQHGHAGARGVARARRRRMRCCRRQRTGARHLIQHLRPERCTAPGAARAVHLAEGPRRGPPRRGPAVRTTQGGKTASLLPPMANRRHTLRPERYAVTAALAAARPRCRAPGAASSGAHLRPTRRVHLAH
ncbi:hypothetical protein T492DRAFT_1144845 [Pavlovales sp. CCMP2436]|nr:hypothetical protein T492DRAFT_1144845 [Pavlovales sp. CCMP2436]